MNDFCNALLSEKKNESIPDDFDWFGPLIGEWDFIWTTNVGNENEKSEKGEWIFSRILNGFGIQDLFIIPPREESVRLGTPNTEYGTTIRTFNVYNKGWEVYYTAPGEYNRLSARQLHAYLEEDGCRLYHGTLMVAANLDQMERVLTPSKLKLSSKGISSVRSRVMNLSEYNLKITIDSLTEAIENSFMEIYGPATRSTRSEIPYDESLERSFASEEWLYNSAPQYQLELEQKISEGNVSFHLEIENGRIVRIQANTDSLDLNLPNRLSAQWMGRKIQEFRQFFDC